MSNMKTSLLTLFVLASFSCIAQTVDVEVPGKKVTYFNTFMAGGLIGEKGKGTGVTFSTIHGVRIKRASFGAGIGFDSYLDWKTLPIFGSLNFDFARIKSNALFVQFNAGYAEAWLVRNEGSWTPPYRDYGGTMVASSVGYRITKERFSLYVMAGHKFQRAHLTYEPELWSSFAPSVHQRIEEDMNRLVVQIGFGLR
jgi:hypothetical protein